MADFRLMELRADIFSWISTINQRIEYAETIVEREQYIRNRQKIIADAAEQGIVLPEHLALPALLPPVGQLRAARQARLAAEEERAAQLRAAREAQAQAARAERAAREEQAQAERAAREEQAQAAQAAQAAREEQVAVQMDPEMRELRRIANEDRKRAEQLIIKIRQQKMYNEFRLALAARQNNADADRFEQLARQGRLSDQNVDLLVDRVVPPIPEPPKPGNGPFPLPQLEAEQYDEDIVNEDLRAEAEASAKSRVEQFATEMHQKIMCPICLGNKVNRAFVPCGHFICSVCLQGLSVKKCHCGTPYSTVIPIYLMKYLKYKNKYLQLKKTLF
jgi:hypothetical protein